VVDLAHETNPQSEPSPVWKESDTLTPDEIKALEGIINVENHAAKLAKEIKDSINLPLLATDFYEEAFKPLGHPSRNYRNTNTLVVNGELEYPAYQEIPGLMGDLNREVEFLWKDVALDPNEASKILDLCSKIHEMIYIHPFMDGNGRVTRALVHLALYRFGYRLPHWRYSGRDGYLDAVSAAWHNPKIFKNFLAKALISSYKEIEEKYRMDDDLKDDRDIESFIKTRIELEEYLKNNNEAL